MGNIDSHNIVIRLRALYSKVFHPKQWNTNPNCLLDKETIQSVISEKMEQGHPLMVARLGSIECDVCENIRYTFFEKHSNWDFIRWKGQPNFLNPFLIPLFSKNAGFFPIDDIDMLKRFYLLMIESMKQTDVLGSWRLNEAVFEEELRHAVKVDREKMTPLLTKTPWSKSLMGKKVLVVSPFTDTIESQYKNRDLIFPNDPDILPEFKLQTIKAVQSAGGEETAFDNWFEALKYMEDEIDKQDYDVCLLGCGAYGFPLAAHCKQKGKQAVHLGGTLQLMFGIVGRRWEIDPGYIYDYPYLPTYKNEYWVRPSKKETPVKSKEVEDNCYW